MKMNHKPTLAVLNRRPFKGWIVCGIALASFAAGSLITSGRAHANQVRADSNRVFELMIYHTVPGKAEALEGIFSGRFKADGPAWRQCYRLLGTQ